MVRDNDFWNTLASHTISPHPLPHLRRPLNPGRGVLVPHPNSPHTFPTLNLHTLSPHLRCPLHPGGDALVPHPISSLQPALDLGPGRVYMDGGRWRGVCERSLLLALLLPGR